MVKFNKWIFICILILQVNSLLPPEKREELWNKYLKEISPDDFENLEESFNSDYLEATYTYEVDKINEILNKYGFPQNYSFLEEHNITANVKNQGSCGCCWSHAATSALAYRYKLKGLDLDLSPQDGLSCYIKDCEVGNYLISPEMNLIKNGTLTESCFPFVSGNGKYIPECPTTCEDGSEFKRYHSQNAYKTELLVTQKNFYDYITLIIDLLHYKGPVVSGIVVYQDFKDLHYDQERCHNEVYSYDGYSENLGGHAVTMVGYGFMNGKFYWLIQNSWGKDSCDGGFVKIEFGQVGVESIAFSEPYIEEEGKTPVEIPVKFDRIDDYCNLFMKVDDNKTLDNWKNSFELIFESKDTKNKHIFYYQCGILSSNVKSKEINCYIDTHNFFNPMDTYIYKEYRSLGTDNKFNIDLSNIKNIEFRGNDYFYAKYSDKQLFYVSERQSKILIFYYPQYEVGEELPSIALSFDEDDEDLKILNNCKRHFLYSDTEYFYFVTCELSKNEINYFDKKNTAQIVYENQCGIFYSCDNDVVKLDKSKYPVYRIKSVFVADEETITRITDIILNVEIEGTILKNIINQEFIVFTQLEYHNSNTTYLMLCETGIPSEITKEYNITCRMYFSGIIKYYDNLYVLPYIIPYKNSYPYEVILKRTIKPGDEIEPEPEPTDTDSTLPQPTDSDNIRPGEISSFLSINIISFIISILMLL